MHAWSEHVVHVELVSDDSEISEAARRYLEACFEAGEPEVHASAGRLRVHTQPANPVSAAQVAHALADAGVRVHSAHERQEWSVTEL